jgi:hypothetical protein
LEVIYIYNNKETNNKTTTESYLILSSFLCDSDLKVLSKRYAAKRGLSWAKVVNLALFEYLHKHSDDPVTSLVVKQKPLVCQVGECKLVAVTSGVYLPSGKEKRLCAVHVSLFSKDQSARKVWKII